MKKDILPTALEYILCYLVAWVMIATFPLWLPFCLAVKVYRSSKKGEIKSSGGE